MRLETVAVALVSDKKSLASEPMMSGGSGSSEWLMTRKSAVATRSADASDANDASDVDNEDDDNKSADDAGAGAA